MLPSVFSVAFQDPFQHRIDHRRHTVETKVVGVGRIGRAALAIDRAEQRAAIDEPNVLISCGNRVFVPLLNDLASFLGFGQIIVVG